MIESLSRGVLWARRHLVAIWVPLVAVWLPVFLLTTGCGGGSYAGSPESSYGAAGDAMSAPMAAMEASDSDSGGSYAKAERQMSMDAPAPPPMQPSPQGAKQGAQTAATTPAGPSSDPARQSPILIYTANFTMSVFEVEKSLEAIDRLAQNAGGYLSRRDDQSITVRVPAAKFQEMVTAIEKVGDVLHRNVVSEDVTAEFRDLEVQVQNLLALRSRFEKLLEKAVKVEEALQIERELGRITGEIERIKGRLKLLTDLAQYSTITVAFQPRAIESVQEGPFLLPLPWLSEVGLRRLMNL